MLFNVLSQLRLAGTEYYFQNVLSNRTFYATASLTSLETLTRSKLDRVNSMKYEGNLFVNKYLPNKFSILHGLDIGSLRVILSCCETIQILFRQTFNPTGYENVTSFERVQLIVSLKRYLSCTPRR